MSKPDTPDLLLTVATTLRDHLGSIGMGKKAEELSEALKSHEDTKTKGKTHA